MSDPVVDVLLILVVLCLSAGGGEREREAVGEGGRGRKGEEGGGKGRREGRKGGEEGGRDEGKWRVKCGSIKEKIKGHHTYNVYTQTYTLYMYIVWVHVYT